MDVFRRAIVLPTTNAYGTIPLMFILLTSAIGKKNKTKPCFGGRSKRGTHSKFLLFPLRGTCNLLHFFINNGSYFVVGNNT